MTIINKIHERKGRHHHRHHHSKLYSGIQPVFLTIQCTHAFGQPTKKKSKTAFLTSLPTHAELSFSL